MSEVHRYKVVKMLSEGGNRISYDPHGPDVVMASAYDQLKAENEALRKDAERWMFFKDLSCQIQAFPHSWGQMTPEKMDFMCDEIMAKETK